MEPGRLADAAAGRLPADLVLANGRVFDVLTGEFREQDVALFGERIAGVGRYRGLQTLDLRGRLLVPGFVDAGAMLEPSHLTLPEYARAVTARGTTTALFDFRDLAAVEGLSGLVGVLHEARGAPLDVYCALPLSTGETWDTAAARFTRLEPMLLSLPNLAARAGRLDGQALLRDAAALALDGAEPWLPAIVAAPGRGGGEAAALAALGVAADRAWLDQDEALDKLRAGLWLLAEEGALITSVADLKPIARAGLLGRCCLVSGRVTVDFLLEQGQLDHALRQAIQAGLAPAEAIRLVTSQPAALLGLRDRGAILPGCRADLVALDPRSFAVHLVLKDGKPIARAGEPLGPPPRQRAVRAHPLRVGALGADRLAIAGRAAPCRVLGIEPAGGTALRWATPRWADGRLLADPAQDLAKIAVVERHTGQGGAALGFVQGLALREGALCCSFAGTGQHLIVAGMDDESMLRALAQVAGDGGGIAVAVGGEVRAAVALPLAGLLSPLPAAALAAAIGAVEEAAWDLGCQLPRPFVTLAALADASQGGLRLTDRGLVDAAAEQLVPLQD